jgi:hypothetical protein
MTSDVSSSLPDVPDEHVITVLALMLEARSRLPDAATAQQSRQRLSAAAADPTPLQVIDEPTGPIEAAPSELAGGVQRATDVALARTALQYLIATDPAAARMLSRALKIATAPDAATTRLDPLTLLIGGLVLAVLQTEVDWTRTDTGRWKLRIHKRAMRDSTIATLIRGALHLSRGPDAAGDQQ